MSETGDTPAVAETAATTPVTEAASAEQAPATETAPEAAPRPWVPALAVIALVAALAAAGLSAWLWQQWQDQQKRDAAGEVTERLQTLDGRLARLEQDVEHRNLDLAGRMQRADKALEARLERLQQALQTDRLSMQQLRELVGRQTQDWDLAEVAYLLRLAAQRLRYAGDVEGARALLGTALRRVQGLGQAALEDLREAIARDVALLQGVEPPDLAGILLQLANLDSQVAVLPLATAYYPPSSSDAEAPVAGDSGQRDWREVLRAFWEDLKRLVRIERHDRPLRPMLPPERQYFLYSNLRLRLQAARLAVLRGDPKLYRQAIHEVRAWLGEYFDDRAGAVHRMDAALAALEARPVTLQAPAIGHGLRALQALRQKTER